MKQLLWYNEQVYNFTLISTTYFHISSNKDMPIYFINSKVLFLCHTQTKNKPVMCISSVSQLFPGTSAHTKIVSKRCQAYKLTGTRVYPHTCVKFKLSCTVPEEVGYIQMSQNYEWWVTKYLNNCILLRNNQLPQNTVYRIRWNIGKNIIWRNT